MSRKFKIALTICFIVFCAIFNLSNFNSGATVCVESYRVRSGDTFWDITEKYYRKDVRQLYILEYMDEIRELNPQLKDVHYQLKPNDIVNVRYVVEER